MAQLRPVTLSIAGLDPCSGAGLIADIKTFEANKVYGLAVPSCITYQHDLLFKKTEWIPVVKIIEQIDLLKERFNIRFVKIGLIENLQVLDHLLNYLNASITAPVIIWDPVLKASAGYTFHSQPDRSLIEHLCKKIYLLTPNLPEAILLGNDDDAIENARKLSQYCHVYLKGGHCEKKKGKDYLFTKEKKEFSFNPSQNNVSQKHGSGCVLSTAITANLAKKTTLHSACLRAKNYTASFLSSNTSLLGYHKL
ncbi:MAG TPA: hydroxymethylpyrimidine/phosphomethylpyrimidine kinase [Bacteroidia bacterium]|nr:hydroxymethylpyrimidine/phosphomethylpyrimidine kinase [Bacteroidia bacterium]